MARAKVIRPKADGGRRRHYSHHSFGFAEMQWEFFDKALACGHQSRRVKPLLYMYRVLR
jgi:hypothetical protein